MDKVFKALADPHRRLILDRLFDADGQTLQQLCRNVDITRQGLSKHLTVLENAGLVVALFEGREKHHYLNPVPIQAVAERWIAKYSTAQLAAVSALKKVLEEQHDDDS
ncbi:MAG: helix-turn-helix domain-containing protein [Gammaproteobacteria bacterium]|nr:helix-turn-helix domain-containing protein [Gammaproteobacteria bacterium]